MSLAISSTIKSHPKLPYDAMAEAVLGKKYDVSLVFIGTARAQSINQSTRNKSYVPNVLSFPLTDQAGEIYICPAVAKREHDDYHLSYRGYVGFLFIHGLLHLKGYDHGPKMESLERKYVKQFGLK